MVHYFIYYNDNKFKKIFINSFIILLNFTLLKFPSENGLSKMLVENEKKDLVYLIMFPRISINPSHWTMCLKIESWLKITGINFYRISNQFLLGSPNSGINKLLENEKEKEVLKKGKKILTKDRTTRYRKIGGKTFGDNAVRSQFFQSHPQLFEWRWQEIKLNNKKIIKFEMSIEFWNEFFEIERGIENIEINEEKVINFMEKHLIINEGFNENYLWNLNDWNDIYEWINKFIENKLKEYFTEGKESMEVKLREYLERNSWDQISDEKIYELFDKILQRIINILGTKKFLFGDLPSLADISLFSVLIQFYEGNLNIPVKKNRKENDIIEEGISLIENNELIEKENKYLDKRIQIIYNFIERIKNLIGLEWNNLKKYPWPLNYEKINYKENNKYSGPFNVQTDEMNTFVSQLDNNNKWKEYAKTILNKKTNKWLNIYFGKNKEEINEIEQIILNELFNYLNNFWKEKDEVERKMFGKIILHSIASYLCNLGKQNNLNDSLNCQKIHKNKIINLKENIIHEAGKSEFIEKGISYFRSAPIINNNEINDNINFHVKKCLKIVNEIIQKYNENKITKNLEEAINKAFLNNKKEN
ncbi:GST_C_6 domain-containing protein [Meloidogyne graminicola]|uniref:GST_C_6 domain-containing protein n=1 Tax=Meloidogyne graminicola TaxID=189291 RepID=A0A8S9ZRP5_9BILA|nr:GST_C_6 domain-containing protein [Meloidogyne graminicola]